MIRFRSLPLCQVVVVLLIVAGPARGDLAGKAAREVAERLGRGLRGATSRRAARHVDDAARAVAPHLNVGLTLVPLARSSSRAMTALAPRNARRLAILAEDGALARSGRWGELLAVIERHGDRALTFVWRNKGALTVTTVLEKLLADPHAFQQCLLARCLPQREHDRQPCARRCRWTDARKRKVRKLAGPRNSRGKQSALPGQECWWSRLQKESSVFLSPLRLPLSFPRSLRRRGMQREPGGSGPKLKGKISVALRRRSRCRRYCCC